ncbi:MAG: pseudouridine synthase [Pseudomonadota bacterium]|nr:pseudouridine synthase [Pseudomonadota bacterium]NLX32017.1 rRNA pseudouridine synthase [Deltaproteobacteria bacterium]HNU84431.1 pseudouridine synthase [Syntrophales bacterium]HNZ34363.1 pseudouridine synthase [Syntrophales bacterium]HOF73027.1 pseudouridine synthase [Syntrophales bacterium]
MEERLQKIIAAAGICSRRAAEDLILAGKVQVNDRVVRKLGTRADPGRDEIRVDGRLITTEVEKVYLMLNKPAGYVTTLKDPEGRPIVTDLLREIGQRVFPAGRLDYDSEGLLILTNDGDFAERIQHPRYEVPRTYLAKIRGRVTRKEIQSLINGIELEDGPFTVDGIQEEKYNEKSQWLRVSISEGRNRIIRRAMEALGHPVARLIRVSVGNLELGDLKPGQYRRLQKREVERLLRPRRKKA